MNNAQQGAPLPTPIPYSSPQAKLEKMDDATALDAVFALLDQQQRSVLSKVRLHPQTGCVALPLHWWCSTITTRGNPQQCSHMSSAPPF